MAEISVQRVERIEPETMTETSTATVTVVNAAQTSRIPASAPPPAGGIDKASRAYIDKMKRQWAAEEAAATSR
uniref:Uncharacterized protein n=1 Tax=Leersia perrieri TaxID=77586 RepID=A0A0D9WCM4_9ORYZ